MSSSPGHTDESLALIGAKVKARLDDLPFSATPSRALQEAVTALESCIGPHTTASKKRGDTREVRVSHTKFDGSWQATVVLTDGQTKQCSATTMVVVKKK